jgi:UTP--glucose-1-phosphate uridylyltransferase
MTRFQIRTAVFPVAGRGTRFLPATKASPKEMLPIVDKPLIQYAAEEALQAGATRLVFITGSSKHAIADHFDSDRELENLLEKQGKDEMLRQIRGVLPSYATCIFIRQPAPLGLGHAVLCAEAAVGNEPFYVLLADDLIVSETACLKQLGEAFNFHRGSILGVEEVPRAETDRYGIVKVENASATVSRVLEIVEKPKPAVAPSTLAVVGRYVLTHRLFDELRHIGEGAGGEIQLTDGIARLMEREAVYAQRIDGRRYDCGSKQGYLEATVEQALRHPEVSVSFRAYLRRLGATLDQPAAGAKVAKAAVSARAARKPARTGQRKQR